MIDKIITGYMASNKRLVVPGFGTFLRKDTGEVVFVEFLKKDDGVLTSLIREGYLVSDHEAMEMAHKFVSDVKQRVAETGRYDIAGLGSIRKGGNGVYDIHYDPSTKAVAAPATPATPVPVVPAPAPPQPESKPQPHDTPVAPQRRQAPEYYGASARPSESDRFAAYTGKESAGPNAHSAQRPPRPEPRPAQRPPMPPRGKAKRSKMDKIMIVAIIAAFLALCAIGYGLLVSNGPAGKIEPTAPAVEQTPADTTQTEAGQE